MVLLAVPFSLVGAVWLLWLLGYHLSVAVWVGMIALAGLDAETGVLMLLYLNLAHRDRVARGLMRDRGDLREAIVEGAAHRIRPKHMTVLRSCSDCCRRGAMARGGRDGASRRCWAASSPRSLELLVARGVRVVKGAARGADREPRITA